MADQGPILFEETINVDDPIAVQQEPRSPPSREDEINLLDLLLVPLKHKKMIGGIVFTAAVLAVVISLLLPNMYQSTAVILPKSSGEIGVSSLIAGVGGSSLQGLIGLSPEGVSKIAVLLESRWLTEKVVTKRDLLKELYWENWDESKNEWAMDEPPSLQKAYLLISGGLLKVETDSGAGTVSVSFLWRDPERAKAIVEYYLEELSETMRQMVVEETNENIRYFNEELAATTDALLRDKIYGMLANEIERQTLAKAQRYYSFVVLEPPLVADPDKEAKPNRSMICIVSVLLATFLAVLLSFVLESLVFLNRDPSSSTRLLALRSELHVDFLLAITRRLTRKMRSLGRKKSA